MIIFYYIKFKINIFIKFIKIIIDLVYYISKWLSKKNQNLINLTNNILI